ncbi:MAG: polyprenyl synthetase family protein [Oscillospiraceae bacterium]|nr:polyprenyl synthetase family protein [Oscillospiraceae bacterium]
MNDQYERYRAMIERGLERYLPYAQLPQIRLLDAMTYSVLGGGKRIRPVLTLAFCEALGGAVEGALPFACAAEMIHAYSLIHDDLPCMDDDDVRRGRPSNHRMFVVSGAVLAWDALLSAAFETMLDADYYGETPPERVIKAAHRLAWASGLYGMAGGQQLDMDADGLEPNLDTISRIYLLKTAALFNAAVVVGCELAGAAPELLASGTSYARCLGLAFQIKDDLDDLEDLEDGSEDGSEGMPEAIGKETSAGREKLTMVGLVGAEECRRVVGALTEDALAHLSPFPNNDFIVWLTRAALGADFS